MPIKIVRKATVVATEAPLGKQIKVGDCIVCPTLDFSEERGVLKFLVHIRKNGLWYKLLKQSDGVMFLESSVGTQFESKVNSGISKNYVLVKCLNKQDRPSPAAMEVVQRLIAKVSKDNAPESVVEPPKAIAKVDTAKKYGKVRITRRGEPT